MNGPAVKPVKPKTKAKVKSAGKSNKPTESLVKVVVPDDKGEWISPDKGSEHVITKDATFPKIICKIKLTEQVPVAWSWKLTWDAHVSGLRESAKRGNVVHTFNDSGKGTSSNKDEWTVDLDGKILGGILTVTAVAGTNTFQRSFIIKAENPGKELVSKDLATIPNTKGFDKLLEQETHWKHIIAADGQPVVALDKGYGITQLTNPVPTFEQVWNWKQNLRGGAKLYQAKQKDAIAYLTAKGRTATDKQIELETFARWNGGTYHVWDESTKQWVRNPNILCDTQVANAGWNTSTEANSGKTADELHKRDASEFPKGKKKGQSSEHPWIYTGVCYADHLEKQ
jgi:hypothetical protein